MDNFKKYKFICGNAFKHCCRYSVGKYHDSRRHDFEFKVRAEKNNDLVFIKTEYTADFFRYIDIDHPFSVITHNSDITIDENFLPFIENEKVNQWYGQNINISHEKVKPIPIGLANPKWPHGNPEIFEKIRNELINGEIKKDKLFYVNFDIYTNLGERQKCLSESGLKLEPKLDFESYLRELARSYFVISPNGNGIDCHKNWEALYLESIPVVSQGINANYFKEKGIPLLVVGEWGELKNIELCPELYKKIWKEFDSDCLIFDDYLLNLSIGEF